MTDKTITVTLRMDLDDLAAQFRAAADALTDRYAANEARQRAEASLSVTPSTDATVSQSEPDPLDEDDHRDRIDGEGSIWQRVHEGCWAEPGFPPVSHGPAQCLQLAALPRPIAFAPDASPAPQDAAQGAAEGAGDAVEGGGAAGPSGALLCPECGHDIDRHVPGLGCLDPGPRPCALSASGVARELIEQAVAQATGADQHVTLPDGWELVDGHDVRQVGWEPGWREGLVVRDHRRWYALSASTNDWRVCDTKQAAVDWIIQRAGGGRG